jgi:hypothetical protein
MVKYRCNFLKEVHCYKNENGWDICLEPAADYHNPIELAPQSDSQNRVRRVGFRGKISMVRGLPDIQPLTFFEIARGAAPN